MVALNLGSATGHTVRQLPAQVLGRREDDAARSFADPRQAEQLLGWRCRRDLQTMCDDSWCWQSSNPKGYRG